MRRGSSCLCQWKMWQRFTDSGATLSLRCCGVRTPATISNLRQAFVIGILADSDSLIAPDLTTDSPSQIAFKTRPALCLQKPKMQGSLGIRTANNNSSASDVASTVDCGNNHGHSFDEYGSKPQIRNGRNRVLRIYDPLNSRTVPRHQTRKQ